MKHIKNIAILIVITFLISYFGGAFYSWDLSAGDWLEKVREHVIGAWSALFLCSMMVYMVIQDNKNS